MFYKGLGIACFWLIIDQATKWWALHFFECCDFVYEVTSFFNIVLVFNTGVSFGLFSGLAYGQFYLSAFAVTVVCVLLYWMYTSQRLLFTIALAHIIGGAIGNIIDRVRIGAVVDFLDFHLHNHHWPAFNVADSVILIGAGLLIIDMFTQPNNKEAD